MNRIITDGSLLAISIIICLWYLEAIKTMYGRTWSISASARELKREGKTLYFYLFITLGICVPLAWVGHSYLTTFAAMILFGIGMITGYDPALKNRNFQNTLHVILTNIAILLFILGIILINYWLAIVVGVFFVPCLILYLVKPKDYVWKVEVLIIYCVWISLLIEKVILPILSLEGSK